MKLFVDLDTLQLIEGPGFRNPVESLRFKRGDAARLDVMFLIGGSTPTTIGNPATLEIHFGAKLKGQYGADYIVHTSAWTLPAPAATSPVYSCTPSFNTTALNEALDLGGNESAEITLMGEITWREGTGAPTSTRTVQVVVENDVNRGTEGTPMIDPTPDVWLAARAAIMLVSGIPSGGPIYEVTIAGNRRLLAYVSGTNDWSDGLAEPPFSSITLVYDISGVWILTDSAVVTTWTSNESVSPVGVTWTRTAGTSSETPIVTESTIYPRLLHYADTGRTWITPSAYGDVMELVPSTPDGIAAALQYTPADDASVVHRTGPETLSGQLELTGQTAANGTSAMTRDLARQQRQLLDAYDNWDLFGSSLGMVTGGAAGTGAYVALTGTVQGGTGIGGYARLVLAQLTTRPAGSGANNGLCAVPLAMSVMGSMSPGANSAVRIIFGAKITGTPYWSNQNPLTARGFGLEIYTVSGVAKMRLFTHNGTTFAYGPSQNYAGIWTGVVHLVIASNGLGRVQLYHAGSDTHVALGIPVLQSAMTMNTGPTSGTYGEVGAVTLEAVGDNTNATSALGVIMRGRMFLNHSL